VNVSLQYAESHLADLADAVDKGEPIEISRPDKPTLSLIVSARPPAKETGRRILGAGRGEMRVPSEEEWAAMDKELERQMNAPLWKTPERPRAELFGSLKGKIELAQDWDSPETNKEIEDLFENSEIFPDTLHG
jgi:antitoxin (DNA-binding transcriptional repressor) of toxin-antitoxin stability system